MNKDISAGHCYIMYVFTPSEGEIVLQKAASETQKKRLFKTQSEYEVSLYVSASPPFPSLLIFLYPLLFILPSFLSTPLSLPSLM